MWGTSEFKIFPGTLCLTFFQIYTQTFLHQIGHSKFGKIPCYLRLNFNTFRLETVSFTCVLAKHFLESHVWANTQHKVWVGINNCKQRWWQCQRHPGCRWCYLVLLSLCGSEEGAESWYQGPASSLTSPFTVTFSCQSRDLKQQIKNTPTRKMKTQTYTSFIELPQQKTSWGEGKMGSGLGAKQIWLRWQY